MLVFEVGGGVGGESRVPKKNTTQSKGENQQETLPTYGGDTRI